MHLGGASAAAVELHKAQTQYGVGSPFGRAAQALTGLASGIAGGNIAQGLSAAAAPYMTSAIGGYFDNLEVGPDGKRYPTPETILGRLLAHAAAGAAVAYVSDNNAGIGAVGAVSGEAMAMLVHQQLYDGKPVSELTQAEKENIRAAATLASGLVGEFAGGSFENAAIAANAGYNAVVNNEQHVTRLAQLSRDQVITDAESCQKRSDRDACLTDLRKRNENVLEQDFWNRQYQNASNIQIAENQYNNYAAGFCRGLSDIECISSFRAANRAAADVVIDYTPWGRVLGVTSKAGRLILGAVNDNGKSTKGRINDASLPTSGRIRYVPPDSYNPSTPLPKGPNNGYIDRFGNEWIKGPSRTAGQPFEWDVQLSKTGKQQIGWATRDGSHANVSLDGEITHR